MFKTLVYTINSMNLKGFDRIHMKGTAAGFLVRI